MDISISVSNSISINTTCILTSYWT